MRHVPQLDGIRAVAVLIVLISHAGLEGIVPGGFGVTIFFFLSGYLITSLLRSEFQKTRKIDFRAFYLRRTLRIMPPLYVTLVILTLATGAGAFAGRVYPPAIVWDYLFLSNYSHLWGQEGGLPIPLWSLAVEEHFYLLFPATFILLLAHRKGSSAAIFCALFCVAIFGLRLLTFIEPSEITRNYYWSHTRMDSILFGCGLALWQNPVLDRDAWRPRHWHAFVAVIAILTTFVIRDEVFRETIRYSIQGVGLFVLFSYALTAEIPIVTRLLVSRVLGWIGLISYSLYLGHFAIFVALQLNTNWSQLRIAIVGCVLAFAYAWLMRVFIEKPIMNWRKGRSAKMQALSPLGNA